MFIQGSINFNGNSVDLNEEIQSGIKLNDGYIKVESSRLAEITNVPKFLVQSKSVTNVNSRSNLNPSLYEGGLRFFGYSSEKLGSSIPSLDLGIWYDADTRSLRFLRNTFGTVPLYYVHFKGEFVAFSTDLPNLLAINEVRNRLQLNIDRIIRYCTFKAEASVDYAAETFFNEVKSVLPGHVLSLTSDGNTSNSFIQYNPSKWSSLKTASEYSLALRELLFRSVEKATSKGNIGSHLSGGLDSSSLSAITKTLYPEKKLTTFYAATNTKFTNEDHHAEEVAAKILSAHFEVEPKKNDFELLKLYISLYGQPECMSISPSLQGTLIESACSENCDVLLIGHDGDSIIGTGLDGIIDFYHQKKWEILDSILRKRVKDPSYFSLSKNWKILTDFQKLVHIQNDFFGRRFPESLKELKLVDSIKLYFEVHQHFSITHFYFLKKGLNSVINKIFKRQLPTTILKDIFPQFRKMKTAHSLSSTLGSDLPQVMQEEIASVYSSQSVSFNEQLFALGNYYKIQTGLPYMDKDLFELCMATPSEIKLGDGIGRNHFREAMTGLLPENVRLRRDKAVFSLYGRESAIRLYEQGQDFLSKTSEVWQYIDKDKFAKVIEILYKDNLNKSTYSKCQFHVLKTISLALWLEWFKAVKN